MHNNYVFQNYLESEVAAADPVQLVRMLYQGAIDAVAAARTCIHGRDILGRSRQISKASLILNELALNLDHSQGGEISRTLAELYDYMIQRLNQANFEQSDAPLAEVLLLLTPLSEAWRQCRAESVPRVRPEYVSAGSEYQPLSCMA